MPSRIVVVEGGGGWWWHDVKFCACNSNRKNSIVCQMFTKEVVEVACPEEEGVAAAKEEPQQSEGKSQLWILKSVGGNNAENDIICMPFRKNGSYWSL